MSEHNLTHGSLEAVSANLLYEGLVVQGDVYDADADRMLIRHGTTLSAGNIRALKGHNAGRDTVYVSHLTYRELVGSIPPEITPSLLELEETIGFGSATEIAVNLLDSIKDNTALPTEELHIASVELSTRLEFSSSSAVLSLINALAPVDEYLQRHCVNVSMLNGLMGRWLGMSKQDIDNLVLIGLLHDCGKALVPPQVLNVPRRLTMVEFEVIKMHAVFSGELLTEFPELVRLASRFHHEKISGSGYPDRLTQVDIPLEAKITAVSDIYDAMVSRRAYKDPQNPFHIIATLARLKDSELDAELVDIFMHNMPTELIDKPVRMSDGKIGIIRSFDPEDPEFPMIEVEGYVIKSNPELFCKYMYTAD